MVINYLKSGYNKLKTALSKTNRFFGEGLRGIFSKPLDETTLEQLEQLLYEADLGVKAAAELTEKVRAYHKNHPKSSAEDYLQLIKTEMLTRLQKLPSHIQWASSGPTIILIVGVNGNGKTTSVAKLAYYFKQLNKTALLAAADTFRAAAIDQLQMWSDRLEIELVRGTPKSDPAAVAFDAVNAAKSREMDVLLIDTAGRLHTKTPLMQELEKIKRSCRKIISQSPHEVLLVLDATIGQNAIEQARIFHQFTPLTGIILTKVDGTAKGGIVFSIEQQLGIPVKFIGTGEAIEDLQPFEPQIFLDSIFSSNS